MVELVADVGERRARAARRCRPRRRRRRTPCGSSPDADARDPAERVEHALARGEAEGEELEHRRQLGRDACEPATRARTLQQPVAQRLRRSQRRRTAATVARSAAARRTWARGARAPPSQRTRRPPRRAARRGIARRSSSNPPGGGVVATVSLPPSHSRQRRARMREDRPDERSEHGRRIRRIAVRAVPAPRRRCPPRTARPARRVGAAPAAGSWRARDHSPSPSTAPSSTPSAGDRVQWNHRRSSGRRPSADHEPVRDERDADPAEDECGPGGGVVGDERLRSASRGRGAATTALRRRAVRRSGSTTGGPRPRRAAPHPRAGSRRGRGAPP